MNNNLERNIVIMKALSISNYQKRLESIFSIDTQKRNRILNKNNKLFTMLCRANHHKIDT